MFWFFFSSKTKRYLHKTYCPESGEKYADFSQQIFSSFNIMSMNLHGRSNKHTDGQSYPQSR